jgi:5-methylcytosine-specific restriction endonuclease McrA
VYLPPQEACIACKVAKARGWKACLRHLSPEERQVVEARKAHWEQVRAEYDQGRRTLNAKHRRRLLPSGHPLPACAACGEVPSNSKDLHLDHLIDVLDYVRAGHEMEEAYADDNMWFLCRPCHMAKTKGPIQCPPLEDLAGTHWFNDRSDEERRLDHADWKQRAAENNRRHALVDSARQLRAGPRLVPVPPKPAVPDSP